MKKLTGSRNLLWVSALALVAFTISACVAVTPVPGSQDFSSIEGVNWQVVSYRNAAGEQATPAVDATITLQEGQITGNAGCNNFVASYTNDGEQLTISESASTLMACPDDAMAQEQAFLGNLSQAASFAVADDSLSFYDANGDLLIALAPQTAASLTGVLWQATNYNNGNEAVVNVLSDTVITALFDDNGFVSGTAGCNNYVTGYTVDGSNISFEPAALTMMACVEPEGVMEQEAAFLAALESAATFSIQGEILEMRTADDQMALRFVAAAPLAAAFAAPSADPDPVAAPEAAPAVELPAPAAATGPNGVVIAPAGINVRGGPGLAYPILGVAAQDTQGEIIGRSADGAWWVASVPSAPDGQGWVSAAYVQAANADAVPVVPAPPLPVTRPAIQEGTPYPVNPGTILYSASRIVREGNRVYELEDVYAVPAVAGSQSVMIANNAMQPALSPDGNTLAFHSKQSDKLGLGGNDLTTGQRLRFSNFVEDGSPRWSPSGNRIVFASNRQGDRRWRIYTTPAIAHERPADMTYTELGFGKDPDWHPTQDLLVFKGCNDQGQQCGLYTMNLDGSGRTALTTEASDSMPRWLPDGSGVVFMSEGRDGNWDVYRLNLADGAVTRLTDDPAPDGLPALSPDGQRIAFISKRGGAWGVWVMPTAGGAATQIAAIPGELPDWLSQAVDWRR